MFHSEPIFVKINSVDFRKQIIAPMYMCFIKNILLDDIEVVFIERI